MKTRGVDLCSRPIPFECISSHIGPRRRHRTITSAPITQAGSVEAMSASGTIADRPARLRPIPARSRLLSTDSATSRMKHGQRGWNEAIKPREIWQCELATRDRQNSVCDVDGRRWFSEASNCSHSDWRGGRTLPSLLRLPSRTRSTTNWTVYDNGWLMLSTDKPLLTVIK